MISSHKVRMNQQEVRCSNPTETLDSAIYFVHVNLEPHVGHRLAQERPLPQRLVVFQLSLRDCRVE